GTYSDGHPLDEVQYLECKLILKPDRFTAAKVFFEVWRAGRSDGKEVRYRLYQQGCCSQAPDPRSALFRHLRLPALQPCLHIAPAYPLSRRLPYWRSGDRFQVSPPGPPNSCGPRHPAEYRGQLPDQVQGRGAPAQGSGGRVPSAVLSQRAVSVEPDARGRSDIDDTPGARVPGLGAADDIRHRQGRIGKPDHRRGSTPGPRGTGIRPREHRGNQYRHLA